MYEVELETAITAAKAAGDIIMDIYESRDFEVGYKADESPVTKADLASAKYITDVLTSRFPDHAILCEETVDDKSRLDNELCWIIDPLDGTKEFINRNGEFTVNIALVKKGEPVVGVIYIPVTKQLYYASEGNGAYYSDKKIKVSKRRRNLVMAVSRSHISSRENLLMRDDKVGKVIIKGSSIKGCLIACGDADIYYRYGPTMEWDTAAMHCIIKEAGGIFMQADDTKMTYNRADVVNRKGFYALNNIKNILHSDNRGI